MIEIRMHGRGGQGTVVASKILAEALVSEGKFAQAFPEYGVERRGRPVATFLRVNDHRIFLRCKIYHPDMVVVLDPTLIEGGVNVFEGLKDGGKVLINTPRKPDELNLNVNYSIATIDATSIAVKYGLGSKTAPIVNTPMVGAFAAWSGIVSKEAILKAVYKLAPIKKEENVKAAEEAYEVMKEKLR